MKKHSILSLTAVAVLGHDRSCAHCPADRRTRRRSEHRSEDRARRLPGEDHGLQRLPHPMESGTAGSGARHDAHAVGSSPGHGRCLH